MREISWFSLSSRDFGRGCVWCCSRRWFSENVVDGLSSESRKGRDAVEKAEVER